MINEDELIDTLNYFADKEFARARNLQGVECVRHKARADTFVYVKKIVKDMRGKQNETY